MSSTDFDPPYVFANSGTFTAPYTFTVPASLAVRPDTAHATFDGTGTGSSFLACLTFYDSSGNLLARMFNPTPVAGGDVAQVTFIPPFGSAPSSSSGGGGNGLQFTNAGATYGAANKGTALSVEADGTLGSGDFPNRGIRWTVSDGVVFEGTDPAMNPAVTIEQEPLGTNNGWSTLVVETDDNGFASSGPTAIEADAFVSTSGSAAQGLIGSAGGGSGWTQTGTHPAGDFGLAGVYGNGDAESGSTGNAVGVLGQGENQGTGIEAGVVGQSLGGQTGANSIALGALDHTGAWIFQVRDDGSIHTKAGVTTLTDDL